MFAYAKPEQKKKAAASSKPGRNPHDMKTHFLNKSMVNYSNIIQKRNPDEIAMNTGSLLSHGTDINDFLIDRNNPQLGTKSVPDAPAWFAVNKNQETAKTGANRRHDFNIHASLHTLRANRKLPTAGEMVTIYIYEYSPREDLNLAKWNRWSHAAEFIFRKQAETTPSLYFDCYKSVYNNDMLKTPQNIEKVKKVFEKEPTSAKERIVMQYYKNTEDDIGKNRVKPARLLDGYLPEKDGYKNETDVVRKEPEVVLFQRGLNKLLIQKKSPCNITLKKVEGNKRTYEANLYGHIYTYTLDPSRQRTRPDTTA